MVQEIQMLDEPRRPVSLNTPRGPRRAEQLRAVVELSAQESKPKKFWLLENATIDHEGGFTNRNSPFQSSLNDAKARSKQKKPGLFKGIGHMFRFGKHRKDGVAPVISNPTPIAAVQQDTGLIKPKFNGWLSNKTENDKDPRNQSLPSVHGHQRSSPAVITTQPKERHGPPQYVSPPPAPVSMTLEHRFIIVLMMFSVI